MLDLDYIEQTAYNHGYRRGFDEGRKKALLEYDEILSRRFAEMSLALRNAEAEIAKCVRKRINDGDGKENDGDETD